MTTVDTHKLFKELVASGMPKKQAEVVSNATLSSRNSDNLATKEQVGILEKEQFDIKTDLAVIKQTMATKSDLAELKTEIIGEIIGIKTNMKWVITLLLGILGVLIKSTFF